MWYDVNFLCETTFFALFHITKTKNRKCSSEILSDVVRFGSEGKYLNKAKTWMQITKKSVILYSMALQMEIKAGHQINHIITRKIL